MNEDPDLNVIAPKLQYATEGFGVLSDHSESLKDQIVVLKAEKKMEHDVMDDIIIEQRQELKDAYEHISVLEVHMENLLQRVYTMEIENDKRTK